MFRFYDSATLAVIAARAVVASFAAAVAVLAIAWFFGELGAFLRSLAMRERVGGAAAGVLCPLRPGQCHRRFGSRQGDGQREIVDLWLRIHDL